MSLRARVFHAISRRQVPARSTDNYALAEMEARRFLDRFDDVPDLRGRRVLDVGCGLGSLAVEAAERGATHVVGVDIPTSPFASAPVEEYFERRGVAARVSFVTTDGSLRELDGSRFDVIMSKDSFHHYADPERFVETLARLLAPGGYLLIGFGPLWRSPTGGQIGYVTPVPWAHLVFPEDVIMAERRRFRPDEHAASFAEIRGGMNKMTLSRFRSIMDATPLEQVSFATNRSENPAVRAMAVLSHVPGLRELMTNNAYGVWRAPEEAGG